MNAAQELHGDAYPLVASHAGLLQWRLALAVEPEGHVLPAVVGADEQLDDVCATVGQRKMDRQAPLAPKCQHINGTVKPCT